MVASLGFGRIPGLTACGPTGGVGPILAFELARGPADLLALFGAEPCTSRLMAAQRAGLWLDELGFIPAYAAFLGLGAWALRKGGGRLATFALAAVLGAALLDELEGVVMFRLMAGFPGDSGLFTALFWTVRPKFALLGAGEVLMGLLMLRHGWPGRIASVPMALGGLASLALLFADPRGGWMLKAHNYAWVALLVLALIAAFRPALAAARDRA